MIPNLLSCNTIRTVILQEMKGYVNQMWQELHYDLQSLIKLKFLPANQIRPSLAGISRGWVHVHVEVMRILFFFSRDLLSFPFMSVLVQQT